LAAAVAALAAQPAESRRSQMARASGGKMSIFGELWSFMKVRKKWWLGPIIVTMLMLSVLIVLTEGSAVAPFIYALF
jgi:hypothetical protein